MILKNQKYWLIGVGIIFLSCSFSYIIKPDWGFFGHRKINRMAVFTLPAKMMPLYKKNLSYIEEHAVDPDKRRYATKFEAIRHYIDIDHWGVYPFKNVPRTFDEAIFAFSSLSLINNRSDTTKLYIVPDNKSSYIVTDSSSISFNVNQDEVKSLMNKHIMPTYREGSWQISVESFSIISDSDISSEFSHIIMEDRLMEYGILPYYLEIGLNKLTTAFSRKNKRDILRHSADMGHYIGDAHVPLHTTENYNGQMSNQIGIHAFWESRLPELFSESEYDFFAGKADYIDDPNEYFWKIILKSHSHLEEVLAFEKQLSIDYPSDQQFCFDERLNRTVRIQCPEYSKAYHEILDGMVEERMISSIKSIGDVWYTAWVNAGQPNLKKLNDEIWESENIVVDPNIKTRQHSN